jgi:hypothetical protein
MDETPSPEPQEVASKYDQDVAAALDILSGLKRRLDIRRSQSKNLPEFEKLIQKIPSAEEIANSVQNARGLLDGAVVARREQLAGTFDAIWAAYLTGLKDSGRPFEQLDRARIRVGRLSVESDINRFAVRVQFNGEDVLGWKTMAQPEDVDQLEAETLQRIQRRSIPQTEFSALLLSCVQEQSTKMKAEMKLVRIVDLYRHMPVQMVLKQVASQRNVKVKAIDYPFASFLYDLDLYRESMESLPQGMRLIFHTGGQAETTRVGVVLGSGVIDQPYKKFCFVSLR